MSERPEYMACVRDTAAEDFRQSWCGRDTGFEWHFTGIDHAAFNGRENGRLVACPDCRKAIIEALNNGDETDGP